MAQEQPCSFRTKSYDFPYFVTISLPFAPSSFISHLFIFASVHTSQRTITLFLSSYALREDEQTWMWVRNINYLCGNLICNHIVSGSQLSNTHFERQLIHTINIFYPAKCRLESNLPVSINILWQLDSIVHAYLYLKCFNQVNKVNRAFKLDHTKLWKLSQDNIFPINTLPVL